MSEFYGELVRAGVDAQTETAGRIVEDEYQLADGGWVPAFWMFAVRVKKRIRWGQSPGLALDIAVASENEALPSHSEKNLIESRHMGYLEVGDRLRFISGSLEAAEGRSPQSDTGGAVRAEVLPADGRAVGFSAGKVWLVWPGDAEARETFEAE